MAAFARFHRAALAHKVMLPPLGYEVWFPSLAHTPEVIAELGDRLAAALAAALEGV